MIPIADRPKDWLWEARMPATPSAVRRVRDAAVHIALGVDAREEELQRIRLGVSEAVTNAVRHAYPAQPPGPVDVLIGALDDRAVLVVVADEGCGLDTPSADPGLGMGMKVMAQTADDLVIARRSTGGTEVRMAFRSRRSPRRRPTAPPSVANGA